MLFCLALHARLDITNNRHVQSSSMTKPKAICMHLSATLPSHLCMPKSESAFWQLTDISEGLISNYNFMKKLDFYGLKAQQQIVHRLQIPAKNHNLLKQGTLQNNTKRLPPLCVSLPSDPLWKPPTSRWMRSNVRGDHRSVAHFFAFLNENECSADNLAAATTILDRALTAKAHITISEVRAHTGS